NEVINRKRFVGGAEFLEKLNKPVWGSFIPKTIVFFWIPAHTVTFLLPPDYRVLMSAVLSLVLGAILTFRSGK
ncbi:MAG: Mpv17/PMP22 family protein, partial [Lentisphaeria bacterium]|nr:Mpv17/PMP22 family protein [Lentisphaeria bacterium]